MGKIDGGMLFAKALKKEKVECVFTLCGGHIMPIFYGLHEQGIKIVDVRHECTAAYAADAYARVTGKPGIVITTAGPGVSNTVTAMLESLQAGNPVIHIGGASPVRENETGPLQDMPTLAVMAASTKWAKKVYSTKRIPEYVGMAFRHALDDVCGPVYLEIGSDILARKIDEDGVRFPMNYRSAAQPGGDPALIEAAADLLIHAKRPALVLGNGARYSLADGKDAVSELVAYLKMPVASQELTRGLIKDESVNPQYNMMYALGAADVVLALGVHFDYRMGKGRPPLFNKDAKIIQVHPDKTEIGFNAPAEIGIVGGTGAVAKQILAALKSMGGEEKDATWLKKAEEMTEKGMKYWKEGFHAEGTPVSPGRCAAEVAKFLDAEGRDWTVVCDGGDASQWIKAAVCAHRPYQILTFGPNGTIGTGPGFSIGAFAANGKPVLYYTGDGSFGFYPMELDTMARFNMPVVCVISNDSAWGMIKLSEGLARGEYIQDRGHCNVDLCHMRAYEKMPEMWGGHGERVTAPGKIVPAIRRAAANGKPSIINVQVDKESMSPVTRSFGMAMKAAGESY